MSSTDDVKANVTVPGVVQKILKPVVPGQQEKAEISVQGADELYREIRIDNTLTNADGETVALKRGAEVDVTVEADPKDTIKKEP
jgi:hypothetical protein